MALAYDVLLAQGFAGELGRFQNPVEAYEALTRQAQVADEYGYATVWAADHFVTAFQSQHMVFESWTTLAALARDTKRVRLGHLVTGNGYRNPALQAKMASTLDVLSHGRLNFGIGAGWNEAEYRAYGYEVPSTSERLGQLREALQVIRAMWTQEEATFEGKYYQIRGAINQPKGVQQPHIPIMIGGGGEKVTLKLVAQYGDFCNIGGDLATIERKFSVLKQHCEAVGRDYNSIRRTAQTLCVIADTDEQAQALIPPGLEFAFPGDFRSYGLIGSIETIRQRLAAYEAIGVQELAIAFLDIPQVEMMQRFARAFIQ